MSAHPLPDFSSDSKKPAAKSRTKAAAVKSKRHTWQEVHDGVRAGGWYRVRNPDLAEKIRLTSGNVCSLLIDLIAQNLGRQWNGKDHEPIETTPLVIEDLALLLRVTAHAINEVLQYFSKRKMATISRLAGGKVVIALHTDRWASIEDNYETWKAKQPKPVEPQEEDAEDSDEQPAAVKAGVVPITRKPERVAAGCRSRAYAIKTGVRDYELDLSESSLDIEMTAAVISGRFVVKCVAQLEKTSKSNHHANRTNSAGYGEKSGSIDPGNAKRVPPNEGIRGEKQFSSVHPRAAEVALLFDPLLLKWCGKSLSEDSVILLSACESITAVPHDYLVKCVIDRAARELKLSHVKALCREISANWEKIKNLPAGRVGMNPGLSKGAQRAENLIRGLDALDKLRKKA